MPAGTQLLFLPRRGWGVPPGRSSERACGIGHARSVLRARHYHAVRTHSRQNGLRISVPRRARSGTPLQDQIPKTQKEQIYAHFILFQIRAFGRTRRRDTDYVFDRQVPSARVLQIHLPRGYVRGRDRTFGQPAQCRPLRHARPALYLEICGFMRVERCKRIHLPRILPFPLSARRAVRLIQQDRPARRKTR